ncbi:GAF domain-containing protein [Mangrovivirga sp. M17]|uniref:GAF domain-containing protein n=1 Tax=Mangrovivirga halotolerans TaxID=2993936 RepID=A0ABT3RWL7_9BACT|nr:GAF domain-containing protein [Mangrovivirga halotolerans]MCX2746043.1 GAF domain-containing protein [Mangrovivirga halotolerans]
MQSKYLPFFEKIYKQSDKVLESLLIGYFIFGIGLSFIYDTFLVGFGVGLINLMMYYSAKIFFKDSRLNQYIGSLVAGIFMAQFIYQMHGLFEMHFTAFIAIIVLIAYQNKYAFIPQFLFVVIHHSSFAYIQYLGSTENIESYKQIYFTQLDYMDFQTFLFHAGLYAVGIIIASIYAHNQEQSTKESADNIMELRKKDESVQRSIDFANEIAKGNIDIEFKNDEDDVLATALQNMRNNISESSKRERQEKFITEGIAKVSDIVRSKINNLEELSDLIVSFMVNYMDANQAALFILDSETEEDLEMTGCYAYDRKKFIDKRIKVGEGLVGQCFLEREKIHLKEIPENYIKITSGLGSSEPREIIIIPIKTDQEIVGILEIATLKKFESKHHKFLDRVSETIASSISTSQLTNKTNELLQVSQQQTEEMRAQEEEMRQNMEELQATQEEMRRKSTLAEEQLIAISNSNIGMIEFATDGTILNANDAFCKLMKYNPSEIEGQHHKIFVDEALRTSMEYKQFWSDLGNGITKSGEFKRIDKFGNEVILYGAYTLVQNELGQAEKVMKFAFDLTSYIETNKNSNGKDLNGEINKVKSSES